MSSSENVSSSVSTSSVPGLPGRLDDHLADLVDDVGIVARAADHGVEVEAAVERVVAGAADQEVVAEAAVELVVCRHGRTAGRCR